MEKKLCKACGQLFLPQFQSPKQQYCSRRECQRERRRRWQQNKRRADPDYRDNDARNSKDWAASHPDYWKKYRESNPDYADRNRNLQQLRNQKRRVSKIANGDASHHLTPLKAGRYRMVPISDAGIANGDELLVEITVISFI